MDLPVIPHPRGADFQTVARYCRTVSDVANPESHALVAVERGAVEIGETELDVRPEVASSRLAVDGHLAERQSGIPGRIVLVQADPIASLCSVAVPIELDVTLLHVFAGGGAAGERRQRQEDAYLARRIKGPRCAFVCIIRERKRSKGGVY